MNRRFVATTAGCTMLALAACGKPEVSTHAADTPFTIVATDSGFVMPDTLHAGLNHFVYENRGREIHECMLIRLPDGMTREDFVAQVASGVDFPEGALDCSGPGLTSPGQRVEMWVALEEGNYMTGCWFRHHMSGHAQRTFVVHGAPRTPVAQPPEEVTVRMVDFRYEVLDKIGRGPHILRFTTGGPSMHEADVFRLDDGRSVDDVRAWMLNDKAGDPPGTLIGGALDSHDLARPIWVRYDFTPAHYVFWCDMPIVQTSEPNAPHTTHAEAGMFKEVVVE